MLSDMPVHSSIVYRQTYRCVYLIVLIALFSCKVLIVLLFIWRLGAVRTDKE